MERVSVEEIAGARTGPGPAPCPVPALRLGSAPATGTRGAHLGPFPTTAQCGVLGQIHPVHPSSECFDANRAFGCT